MKVLMVCLGNICRSPLAEGILKAQLREKELDWQVDSAGTGSWHIGESPDLRSIRIARQYGLDITDQRARQLVAQDLENFDLVVAMDRQNYRDIMRFAKTEPQRAKVKLMLNFLHPDQNRDVPDPYWDDDGFEAVFKMLEKACAQLIATYANG
ncbi:MAG TPA: low molecular weight protein-tyrosine-phosphatase [Saprospiraceae bacterium]|nr:low molecular weight protein-tyrosine-phosphatase [Saprospiraceae bacterium]HMP23445.1 low molecular weight protein-tyrosine-phosphatase [Saprospiraceae bacterium]